MVEQFAHIDQDAIFVLASGGRRLQVLFTAELKIDLVRLGLRFEYLNDGLHYFIRVEDGVGQQKLSVFQLSEVKQVLNEGLHKFKLAHSHVHVFNDFWIGLLQVVQILEDLY